MILLVACVLLLVCSHESPYLCNEYAMNTSDAVHLHAKTWLGIPRLTPIRGARATPSLHVTLHNHSKRAVTYAPQLEAERSIPGFPVSHARLPCRSRRSLPPT